jgi:hypothetical protein
VVVALDDLGQDPIGREAGKFKASAPDGITVAVGELSSAGVQLRTYALSSRTVGTTAFVALQG